jgi:type I site-specific restriction-modification system R (restriction) subunit
VNRPYENEKAEMVKLHGFVLDFVGIFDKLEKALAFDSEGVYHWAEKLDVDVVWLDAHTTG